MLISWKDRVMISQLHTRPSRYFFAFVTLAALACPPLVAADVTFDVNPQVPARNWTLESGTSAFPDSRFVAIRLNTTAFVQAGSSQTIDELLVRVDTRHAMVQVADYWPRTEMYSPVVDNILVQNEDYQDRQASIQGAGGYPGIGWANGQASVHHEKLVQQRFAEKPVKQQVTAAGTLNRKSAVYFKLNQSPEESLEGAKNFDIVLEVPMNWRGDLLTVSMQAFGRRHAKDTKTSLASSRFMVATYQEGDAQAAQLAYDYVVQEQRLREKANEKASEIHRRSYPTPVHKLGAALDVYEPQIPNAWLDQIVFGWTNLYPTGPINKLPVDVRVVILDYLDAKRFIEQLPSQSVSSIAAQPQLASHPAR
jgi:hypothetical protein